VIGLIASLLVAGFWIWCHAKLQRFLFNAAYFMNEPHNLPTAKALVGPNAGTKPAKKPAAPARPSAPRVSQPAIARSSQPVVAQPPPPPVPQPPRPPVPLPPRPEPRRDASASDGEPKAGEPRFLR
jgi:hypothetical protein